MRRCVVKGIIPDRPQGNRNQKQANRQSAKSAKEKHGEKQK
jgi:hypothetical protein